MPLHPTGNLLAAILLTAGLACPAAGPVAAGGVELVSVAPNGTPGNSQSRYPVISGDARYVLFASDATDLVSGDTNQNTDLFLRDRLLGTTTRVNLTSAGSQTTNGTAKPGGISGDGQRIVFRNRDKLVPTADLNNCYMIDLAANTITVIDTYPDGTANDYNCDTPVIDRAGRKVAFTSSSALLPGDNRGTRDVYVRDLVTNSITRISRRPDGGEPDNTSHDPQISADGSRVAFFSIASDLVANDTNVGRDIFLSRTDGAGAITRESVGSFNGELVAPGYFRYKIGINGNGSMLAFDNMSPSLPWAGEHVESNLYVRLPHPTWGVTSLIASWMDEGWATAPDFDATGRWVVFVATDELGQGTGSGIYVMDLLRGATALVGVPGVKDGHAEAPRISADGRGIVWYTDYKLVSGDTNSFADVYYMDNPLWEDHLFIGDFECQARLYPPVICVTIPPPGSVATAGF